MKITSSQYLKQSQSLALTPQLQHSLQMLQMSTIDLVQHLQEQALENPFLQVEICPEEKDFLPATSVMEDPDLKELQTEAYTNIWAGASGASSFEGKEKDTHNWIEETVAQSISLTDHLLQQLKVSTDDPDTLKIGQYLIDLVDENGFLRTDLEEVAAELGISFAKVSSVLSLLQTFDPIGVCARSLEESFLLQLREKNFLTGAMERVLTHLSLVTTQGPEMLRKKARVTKEELKEILGLLRTLNPRPAEQFSVFKHEVRGWDVRIHKNVYGEWEGELNEALLPKVYINSDLYYDLKQRCLASSDKAYIQSQMGTATALVRAIHQRSKTILKVCQAIVQHQTLFFEQGPTALRAMGLRDIAIELGIHESTVSRAIHQKYVHTPWGTFELKYFFGSTLTVEDDSQSNKSIQAFMKNLIDKENKNAPLSDDQLVILLKDKGIKVARRTVAKYREAMKIPSSFSRRKQAELMTF